MTGASSAATKPREGASARAQGRAALALASARRWLAHPVAGVLAAGAASRALVVAVAVLAGAYFPGASGGWNRGPGFVRYFARWDSGYYEDIAHYGYGFKPESWAFDPGFPATIALLHRAFGVDAVLAGFLVANAAFFACLVLFYWLTRKLYDARVASRAAVILAFFPGSFYLSAVYADALFLALALGALLALAHDRYLLAGALASVAAVTRPPGEFLVGAIGVAGLVAWRRTRVFPWRAALGAALSLALPVAFMAYAHAKTGDWLQQNHAREAFWTNVQWHNPMTIFIFSGSPWTITVLVYAGLALAFAAACYAVADLATRRRWERAPAHAFAVVLAIVYVAYSEPNPIVRYLLPVLPAYWMMAEAAESPTALATFTALSAGVLALVAAIFATWGPLY